MNEKDVLNLFKERVIQAPSSPLGSVNVEPLDLPAAQTNPDWQGVAGLTLKTNDGTFDIIIGRHQAGTRTATGN